MSGPAEVVRFAPALGDWVSARLANDDPPDALVATMVEKAIPARAARAIVAAFVRARVEGSTPPHDQVVIHDAETIAYRADPPLLGSGPQIVADGRTIDVVMRARLPTLTGFGLGGLEMERAGLDRVVRAEEVAVMGITEVLRHMPRIFREYRRLVRALERRRPAAAVLIDFPDVNFRLARHCKRLGIPVVWFVSPQLWAWKRRRLRWVQQRVDRMMVIFPFEEPFYRARGVEAEFVGHPLASLPLPDITREQFATKYMFHNPKQPESGSHLSKTWIALLPGSRWKEVSANLPTMLDAAAFLGSGFDFLIPVASTLDKDQFSDFIFKKTLKKIAWPLSSITLIDDARAALHHARAAIVASGTATVQAALIGNPFVVVYRVSPLTFRLAKRLVRYPAEIHAPLDAHGNLPIAMVNLIAGHRIVPELLQDQFTGANVAAALRPLLEDGPARETMIRDLKEVRQRLTPSDGADPIRRVCDAVQALMNGSSADSGENAASIV